MSDEETRERRRKIFLRNKHAKEIKENPQFRIRRVETKRKRNERLTTREWLKKVERMDEDYEE